MWIVYYKKSFPFFIVVGGKDFLCILKIVFLFL